MTVNVKERIIRPILVIAGVISFGTAGYFFVEGWNLFDSLYMTIITLTTVGYGEIHPLSMAGRFFTIILIMFGVGAMLYALGVGARLIFEGEIREVFGRSKLDKKIQSIKDHYIICGHGRMGKIICKEMLQHGAPFVVIENSVENPALANPGVLMLKGDATQDADLKEAGIERAKGLITVLPSDADNLYVVLSARGLNPKLRIVARAGEEGSDKKLLRAGADNVISPYQIGGLRIAHTLLKPSVVDFLEFATRSGNLELQIEEVKVKKESNFTGRTLDECGLRKALRVIIVAIKRETGEMEFNPTSSSVIKTGDTLIAMGEKKQLKELEQLIG